MSERAEDKRLKELRDKGIEIYSISRIDCINRCLYESYRTYILHEKGKSGIYGCLGSRIHSVLEDITNGQATEEALLPAMQDELEDMELLGISFPTDKDGGSAIRDNWIKDIEHFCRTYHAPRNKKLTTEELFIAKTRDDHYLQGYIDIYWTHEKDGSISIFDWKTSTLYKGKELQEHARQLILYAIGKEQEGFTVRNVSWIFVKYAEVKFMGYKTKKSKAKTEIIKIIERRKLGAELAPYIESDMKELGYDELDISVTLDKIRQTAYIEKELPEELKNKYIIRPAVVSVDLTDEAREETLDYIESTISKWESLNPDDENDYPPRKFTRLKNTTGEEALDVFYCTQLCQHFENCKYVKDFLDQWDSNDMSNDDLF